MAACDSTADDSLYPIAVLIDELRNEDVQVSHFPVILHNIEPVTYFLSNVIHFMLMLCIMTDVLQLKCEN